jgi:CBS domain-containing protein
VGTDKAAGSFREARMNVEAILKSKGREVATIAPAAKVGEAVALLRRKGIGALVVSADGKTIAGILSERDIVQGLSDHGAQLLDLPVSRLMTHPVVTCKLSDDIATLMSQMTERRIRHLPVMEDGKLVGIVSIGDVVKNRVDEVESEASSLRQFIVSA